MKLLLGLVSAFILATFMGCASVKSPDVETIGQDKFTKNQVLEQENSKRFLKRKVAIARFSNETKYGKGLFSEKDLLGKQASDILSTKLVQTGKFILFDSSFSSSSSNDKFENLDIPADYLIIGSISEFGRQVTGETRIFSRSKKQTAFAKVFVRLVRVSTGQVVYGEEGTGEAFIETGKVMGGGSSAGYDSSLNDKAIDAAISQLVNNVVNNLLHDPWRSYILDVDGGTIVISGGQSQGIEVGDVFSVVKRGKSVTNPQTGLPVELPGTPVAEISVQSMTGGNPLDEISFCSLVNGELTQDVGAYYIQELKTELGED